MFLRPFGLYHNVVLVFCLCPSSVRVEATFSGTLLFPLLCSVLPFFPNTLILFFIQFFYPWQVSQKFSRII